MLQSALETALHDLQPPRPIRLRFRWDKGRGVLWASEENQNGASGFRPGEEQHAESLVRLIDWLQEQVFAETAGGRGEARPRCPRHSHPLAPIVEAGRAWWVCPQEGDMICPVGEYR